MDRLFLSTELKIVTALCANIWILPEVMTFSKLLRLMCSVPSLITCSVDVAPSVEQAIHCLVSTLPGVRGPHEALSFL